MQHYIRQNDTEAIRRIFMQSRKKLAAEAHPLWEAYMLHLKVNASSYKDIAKLYDDIVAENHENFNALKASYLEWGYQVAGLPYARRIYRHACQKGKPSLEMHNKMAEYEAMQMPPDVMAWRNCLETMATCYGADRCDVWLNFIRFETKHGDAKMAGRIAERAQHKLKADLLRTFTTEYKLMQTGFVEEMNNVHLSA